MALVFYPYLVFQVFDGSWEKMALLGESFGAVSALFSSLAFAGVALSLAMQRKELYEQRRTAEIQSKQNLQSAKISAAISKQEILAEFLVSGKPHPHLSIQDGPGDYRARLDKYMSETDKLVVEAERLLEINSTSN